MKKTFIFIGLVIFSLICDAQTDTSKTKDLFDMSLEELMELEVYTASKKSQKITDAPATVYLISEWDIKNRNYSTLADIFRDIPQIEIQQRGDSETKDIFTINGVSGNDKFLLLIDGIRANISTGTKLTIDQSYTMENVKQVEIILGPASSLYGADAFTGIVNIITNKGYENKGLKANLSYGMFDTRNISVNYGVGKEDFSYVFTGKYYHSNEPFMPKYYPKEYEGYTYYQQTGNMLMFGDTVKPEFGIIPWATPTNAYTIRTKLSIKKFEIGYNLMFESHSNSLSSNPSTQLYSDKTLYAHILHNIYITHTYTSQSNKFSLKSILSGQRHNLMPYTLYINQYSNFFNAYKYEENNNAKIEEQFDYQILSNLTLIGGVSFDYFTAIPRTSDLPVQYNTQKPYNQQQIVYPGTDVKDSTGKDLTIFQDIYLIKYQNIGSYIQLQSQITNFLSITLGSRYDYNTRYKGNFNPRLGLVINPNNKINIKLLFGQAYLAPSPNSCYQHYGSFYPITNSQNEVTGLGSYYWFLPNPNLKPEKRTSYDALFSFQLTNSLIFSTNVYYGNVTNLIVKGNFFNEIFHNVNVDFVNKNINEGSSYAFGGTARLFAKIYLSTFLNINLVASYSYSDGRIADTLPLIYSAKHTVKGTIDIMFKNKFNIYINTSYRTGSHFITSTIENPQMNDNFYVVNMSANYLLLKKQHFDLSLYCQVYNLTNNKYFNVGDDFVYIPQEPLRLNAGIKITIR